MSDWCWVTQFVGTQLWDRVLEDIFIFSHKRLETACPDLIIFTFYCNCDRYTTYIFIENTLSLCNCLCSICCHIHTQLRVSFNFWFSCPLLPWLGLQVCHHTNFMGIPPPPPRSRVLCTLGILPSHSPELLISMFVFSHCINYTTLKTLFSTLFSMYFLPFKHNVCLLEQTGR